MNSVGPGPLAPQRCALLAYDRLKLDACLTSPLVNRACVQNVSPLHLPEKNATNNVSERQFPYGGDHLLT